MARDADLAGVRQFFWAGVVMLVVMGLNGLGWLEPVKLGIETIAYPVRGVTRQVADSLWQIADRVRFVKSGVGRIADLERDNARLRVEVELARSLKEENLELRNLVGMRGVESGWKLVGIGAVVGRPSPSQVLVSLGQKEGVERGMVGVTAEGVGVGEVVEAGEHVSRVRLLTDGESQVGVLVGEKRLAGKLRGTGGEGLILGEVGQGEGLAAGDTVVTGGVEGTYPRGLVVGRVKEVLVTGAEVYQQADVVPAISYNNVTYILFLD